MVVYPIILNQVLDIQAVLGNGISDYWGNTPLKIHMEHNSLEVWFRWFSFPNGWFVGSMLIFQGLSVKVIDFALGICRSFQPRHRYENALGSQPRSGWNCCWSQPRGEGQWWSSDWGPRCFEAGYQWYISGIYILPIGGFHFFVLGGVKPSIFSMGFRVQGFFVGYKDWLFWVSKYIVYRIPYCNSTKFEVSPFLKRSWSCEKKRQRENPSESGPSRLGMVWPDRKNDSYIFIDPDSILHFGDIGWNLLFLIKSYNILNT